MLSCQLVLHAPSFMPFSVSLPFNAYFHGPHVDWAVPSLVTMFHLQNTFIEAIPNWSHGYQAARSSRSQESQELPEASPPHPPQATSATSPTTTETLTPEELELSRQHRATTRESSPAKKPRTDQGWEEFLISLSAKDVELSDLDFGLQQELRSSPQARAGFLALNFTSPEALHFDPDKANSRRLTSPRSDVSLTVNRSKLQHSSILEQYITHSQIDSMDARLTTLESTIDNKSLLLRGLPAAGFTMNNLDWNIFLHEEQGTRVALGLSITIQQLFHQYQIGPGLTTDVHRCSNLILQRPCPLLWLPPSLQQEREELLPADPRFFIWVDQYPPVRLRSGMSLPTSSTTHISSRTSFLAWTRAPTMSWRTWVQFAPVSPM